MEPLRSLPRLALWISDPGVQRELEEILKVEYSSLLLITEREKLEEFMLPLIVIVDTVRELAELRRLTLPEGTRVVIISGQTDSEAVAAAFEAGADDLLPYPFSRDAVVGVTEKYLEDLRGS